MNFMIVESSICRASIRTTMFSLVFTFPLPIWRETLSSQWYRNPTACLRRSSKMPSMDRLSVDSNAHVPLRGSDEDAVKSSVWEHDKIFNRTSTPRSENRFKSFHRSWIIQSSARSKEINRTSVLQKYGSPLFPFDRPWQSAEICRKLSELSQLPVASIPALKTWLWIFSCMPRYRSKWEPSSCGSREPT